MTEKEISGFFEKSSLIFPDHVMNATEKPWYSPPGWNGVFLKDLISEIETNGAFSYHMVRIQENCEVPSHHHDIQWEWNTILDGSGSFILDSKTIPIHGSQVFATPPGVSHTVRAGESDLVLLALFVPGLS